jgi:hypothetical protein
MRAKVAQEETVKAVSVPLTILRATQFFRVQRTQRRLEDWLSHATAAQTNLATQRRVS